MLDAVLALLFVFALVRGWRQGAVLQVAAFTGLALALLAGVWAAPGITGLFVTEPGPGAAFLTLAVLLVAALIGLTVAAGLGRRLHRAVHGAGVGRMDRAAGVGVGGVGFLLVVWLVSSMLAQGPIAALAQQVRGSAIVRGLDGALPLPPTFSAALRRCLTTRVSRRCLRGRAAGSRRRRYRRRRRRRYGRPPPPDSPAPCRSGRWAAVP